MQARFRPRHLAALVGLTLLACTQDAGGWASRARRSADLRARVDPTKDFRAALAKLEAAERALRDGPGPTVAELVTRLRSRDVADRDVALEVMRVRGLHDDALLAVILERFTTESSALRFRATEVLDGMSADQVQRLADGVVAAYRPERSGVVVIASTPLLEQLDDARFVPLAAELMQNVGTDAIVSLYPPSLRKGVVPGLRQELTRLGAAEALRWVDELEKRKTEHPEWLQGRGPTQPPASAK